MLKDYDINKKGREKFGFLTKMSRLKSCILVGMKTNAFAAFNNIQLYYHFFSLHTGCTLCLTCKLSACIQCLDNQIFFKVYHIQKCTHYTRYSIPQCIVWLIRPSISNVMDESEVISANIFYISYFAQYLIHQLKIKCLQKVRLKI